MNYTANEQYFPEILIIGKGRLASSLPVSLAGAGSKVTLCTDQDDDHRRIIETHCRDLTERIQDSPLDRIHLGGGDAFPASHALTFIVGISDVEEIEGILKRLEEEGNPDTIVAISTDHIPLKNLQTGRRKPENILVVNWTEPAHTTLFLEILYNEKTNPVIAHQIEHEAIRYWGKDPYKVKAELGVRGRMTAAMVREALYLIEHGYANIEDIDRACRNDAGTYLPFAGNFQYMDLMGTYAYGVVMEKLNKELSNSTTPPGFFTAISDESNGENEEYKSIFYKYTRDDMEKWEKRMRHFSFEVRSLMEKYPFEYLNEADQNQGNP